MRWKGRTRADAVDVDPRPTQTHKNLKSSNMYVGQLPVHGQKLTLETGLTLTFGSPGEYMLDLTFELGCLGLSGEI